MKRGGCTIQAVSLDPASPRPDKSKSSARIEIRVPESFASYRVVRTLRHKKSNRARSRAIERAKRFIDANPIACGWCLARKPATGYQVSGHRGGTF